MNKKIKPTIYKRSKHSVSRKNIDPDAVKVIYRLLTHNHETYLVGGGVRDILIGKEPKDFDIATNATPNQIRKLFKNSRIIGRRFKLVHIFFHKKILELATFRDIPYKEEPKTIEDIENLYLEKDNIYGSAYTDSIRRDITINALLYNPRDFTITDYVGGFQDLKNKIVRIIGIPEVRYGEDPVRMIRVIRHAIRANFAIEENTGNKIIEFNDLITKCSPPRIHEELKKDMITNCFFDILVGYNDYQILQHIFPKICSKNSDVLKQSSSFKANLIKLQSLKEKISEFNYCTLILTLISVYSKNNYQNFYNFTNDFKDSNELERYINSCFPKYQITKKEKEYTKEILRIIFTLRKIKKFNHSKKIEKLKSSRLFKLTLKFIILTAPKEDPVLLAAMYFNKNKTKPIQRKS